MRECILLGAGAEGGVSSTRGEATVGTNEESWSLKLCRASAKIVEIVELLAKVSKHQGIIVKFEQRISICGWQEGAVE